VGVQCVDCVKGQGKAVRSARTVFGGTVRAGRPRVTQGLIAACVLVYLGQLANPEVTQRFQYAPFQTVSEPWRMITVAFLHSPDTFLHIVFNMYALWLTGPYLEALLGRARFVALYLLSAFGGSVFYLLLATTFDAAGNFDRSWQTPAVGASGAVFGLFGALVVVNRRLNRDSTQIILIIVLNGAIGFFPGWHIAWQAHLGGLVTGVVGAIALAFAPKERRGLFQGIGLAVVAVLLVALTVIKILTEPAAAFA
jgi:membrane associated rhomboid family serine protease